MLAYNPENKRSVVDYAKRLINKTLREACESNILEHNFKGKGNFGQVLEKFYFGYEPNSNSEPDFRHIGLELKSTPLKTLKTGEIRSKERLVLNIINYNSIVNQNFDGSDFWKKNAQLLIIFFLHEPNIKILDYTIKLVDEWGFSETDLKVIKKDWQIIRQKIQEGKAHELSEGDTLYLAACTKGANAQSLRQQPHSPIPAKQRAFSLKQGYVNHIIATLAGESSIRYGKLIPSLNEFTEESLEEIILKKFKPYYTKNVEEISTLTGIKLNMSAKNFYSKLTHAILNIDLKKEIEELAKANIEVKTIRVEKNGQIEQSVSFPAFEFITLYNEHWITSELKEKIEKKFLFIFFKHDGSCYRLEKIKFWNMPLTDRNEVRKIWLKTKYVVQNGDVFNEYDRDSFGNIRLSIKGHKIKKNNFPKISDSRICHVRPHGRDSTETYPLPVQDKKLNEMEYTKQCFWLNNTYVRDEIYL
ncbi:MAG: Sau3AI family type II restriction endonuclease [Sphingobacteriaceae bacterium]|nr:Sau3AI family type II restriction endonuclease [Sphingobacteriaceae bacterium]